jgi:hypothetical protein
MKTRNGFVSNSSSSSFCIEKRHLTAQQIDDIHNYTEVGLRLNKDREKGISLYLGIGCTWDITETDSHIEGSTFIDNFDMHKFLAAIEVARSAIDWNENGHY